MRIFEDFEDTRQQAQVLHKLEEIIAITIADAIVIAMEGMKPRISATGISPVKGAHGFVDGVMYSFGSDICADMESDRLRCLRASHNGRARCSKRLTEKESA